MDERGTQAELAWFWPQQLVKGVVYLKEAGVCARMQSRFPVMGLPDCSSGFL
jgi:hypothetical protein